MALNSSQYNDIEVLQLRLDQTEKERDVLKCLSAENTHRLHSMASGKSVAFFWNAIQQSCKKILPDSYGLLLIKPHGSQRWALAGHDEKNASLLNTEGKLNALPRALITFADSPSCPKRREENIQASSDWNIWKGFLEENNFSNVVMLNVSTKQHDDYLMVFFQVNSPDYDDSVIDLLFDDSINWLKAACLREHSDRLLFEDGHRDPNTSLLRRYSFENNFAMVLKDSRRHFQRVALISLKLRKHPERDNQNELKELAETIQGTVRDNDLVAYYGEGDFVTGIRIRHMKDAEVVVNKLLTVLRSSKFESNKLVSEGVSIGVSFYPEHSSLEDLHRAADFAANSVSSTFGYRVEFHGSVYLSSSEFYSF